MRTSTLVALLAVLGLSRVSFAGSPPASAPATAQFEMDLLISGRSITATPVGGCSFASVSATCRTTGPCSFLLDRTGLPSPTTAAAPRFSVLVDPDGIHAAFTCHAPVCAFTFPAGQGNLDVRRIAEGQSTSGLLKALVAVFAPATP